MVGHHLFMEDVMYDKPYANATEAYKAIHTMLSHTVEACLEDCDYEPAKLAADRMAELERDCLEMMTVTTIEGQVESMYL